jgi:hypothetical protein
MLHNVVLVRTDVLEECITSIIRLTRIRGLGTLAVMSNQSMPQRNTISSGDGGDTFLRNVSSNKSHMV